MTIFLTGATGFIGLPLSHSLLQRGYSLKAAVRHPTTKLPSTIQQIAIGDLLPDTNWADSLTNVDTIIHLAARAHILNEQSTDPLATFRTTNTTATLNLAHQATDAGVHRFIFISSIGVNGNQTFGKPFTVTDTPNPVEPYAISKHEAELGLSQIAAETGMEVVIIRPPLVYGANAPGNFGKLIKTLASHIPLPLGAIHNHRSLVALPNLIDFITTCIDHPAAANQTFLISDDEDLSTTELLRRMGKALGKPARLLPIPQGLLTSSLKLVGKEDIARRLCSSLQVDISKTRELLDWKPVISVDDALAKTAQHFLANRKTPS